MRALTTFTKIITTFALTVLIAKCAMNTWPLPVILHTDRGLLAYAWLLTLLDLEGIEEGEDMLVVISLCIALIISTLLCALLTTVLRRVRLGLTNRRMKR